MREDLNWWINEATHHNGRAMEIPQWDLVLESDASKMGWGACSQGISAGGPWTAEEQKHSINYLELLAAFLGLYVCVIQEENCNSSASRPCDSNRIPQQDGEAPLNTVSK